MNNHKTGRAGACGVLVAIAAIACTRTGNELAGIDGTGRENPPVATTAFGTITGFGSVVVNGVHYDTSAAEFIIDDEFGTQADLSVGEVVLVMGAIDGDDPTRGTALRVMYDDSVDGPVQSYDASSGAIIVLGQTVHVTVDTLFGGATAPQDIDEIAVGQFLDIAGFRRSDGAFQATHIEGVLSPPHFETTGFVSNHDAVARRFNINDLVVDYSTATLHDFTTGAIEDGLLVEVKGSVALGPNGELVATRVQLMSARYVVTPGQRAEIEGLITRFVDARDFDVAGFAVTTSSLTVVDGGVLADLGLDTKIEVEGEIDASGVVVATRIDIRRSNVLRIAGSVDSIDAESNRLVALGITIRADGLTLMDDKSSQQIDGFSLAQLAPNDYVEIRGVELPAGSNELLAGRIERRNAEADAELQGFVRAANAPVLTILGATVTTDPGTEYRDAAGGAISSDAFFVDPVDRLVKVTGTRVATNEIVAQRIDVEIE